MSDPTNTDDTIDSRDVIARIRELEDEREAIDGETDNEEDKASIAEDLARWDAENGNELKALQSLEKELEGYASDWRHGVELIRDSYFETHARELAEDLGAIPSNATWPCTCIDWKQAAEELQSDYTAGEFDGVTYWVRM